MGNIIRKRKLFWVWQWQKEENWINAMAAKGLLLTEVGFSDMNLKKESREHTSIVCRR